MKAKEYYTINFFFPYTQRCQFRVGMNACLPITIPKSSLHPPLLFALHLYKSLPSICSHISSHLTFIGDFHHYLKLFIYWYLTFLSWVITPQSRKLVLFFFASSSNFWKDRHMVTAYWMNQLDDHFILFSHYFWSWSTPVSAKSFCKLS